MMEKRDPKKYREMSVPHESPEAAGEAVRAFFEELFELREKHRIPNLAVVVQVNATLSDGTEGELCTTASAGDSARTVSLFAYGYGRSVKAQEELLAALAGGNPQRFSS